MPYHVWGEKDFDWDSLYEAINIGTRMMKRLGRIGVHSKEKYGTARWSLYFFDGTLHSFTHPGYVYNQYPKWLWKLNCRLKLPKLLRRPIQSYQAFIVKITFSYLCYKFPHIIDEIISDAPRELLTPKLKKRAGAMWRGSCSNKECDEFFTLDNDNCPKCGTKRE